MSDLADKNYFAINKREAVYMLNKCFYKDSKLMNLTGECLFIVDLSPFWLIRISYFIIMF